MHIKLFRVADAFSLNYSNFGVKHLTDLLAGKPKYTPSINQIVSQWSSPSVSSQDG